MNDDKEKYQFPKLDLASGQTYEYPPLPKDLGFEYGLRSVLDFDTSVDTSQLPSGRLRMLMERLAPHIQANLVPMYSAFERWQLNPKKARVEWLVPLYVQKGWLSEDEADEIRGLSDLSAYERLLSVCKEKAQLRPSSNIPARITINETMRESNMSLKELLRRHGISGDLYVRHLVNEDEAYISRAMMTGNDRDMSSQMSNDHHGGRDGEELAMIRTGLNAGQTTYVTKLYDGMSVGEMAGKKYLVFAADALDGIGPQGFPESNGFAAFHFREDGVMHRSLLAVIDNG